MGHLWIWFYQTTEIWAEIGDFLGIFLQTNYLKITLLESLTNWCFIWTILNFLKDSLNCWFKHLIIIFEWTEGGMRIFDDTLQTKIIIQDRWLFTNILYANKHGCYLSGYRWKYIFWGSFSVPIILNETIMHVHLFPI